MSAILPSCPLCGRPGRVAFERFGLSFLDCPSCRFRFHSGRNQGDSLARRYDVIYARPQATDPLTLARYEELLDEIEGFRKTGAFFEVGFGRGDFLKAASRREWRASGSEVSTRAVEGAVATGLAVRCGRIEHLSIPAGSQDVVVMLEVIEHVEDPRRTLMAAGRMLRQGGLLLLSTPNRRSAAARTFRRKWSGYHPEHMGYFSPGGLTPLLEAVGFRVERIESLNLNPYEWVEQIRRALRWREGGSTNVVDAVDDEGMSKAVVAQGRLRTRVAGSPVLRALKRAVNRALNALELGETIWVRATRRVDS